MRVLNYGTIGRGHVYHGVLREVTHPHGTRPRDPGWQADQAARELPEEEAIRIGRDIVWRRAAIGGVAVAAVTILGLVAMADSSSDTPAPSPQIETTTPFPAPGNATMPPDYPFGYAGSHPSQVTP